jgi:surface protein
MVFYNCTSLQSLDLSNWDTSNVTNMATMFSNCPITQLDLSNFDTSKVTSMSYMFRGCTNLSVLDISGFDTSSLNIMEGGVPEITGMFRDCTSLRELRLDNCSSDTISNIINSGNFPASNAGTIYCKEENAANLTLPEGFNWTFSYVE